MMILNSNYARVFPIPPSPPGYRHVSIPGTAAAEEPDARKENKCLPNAMRRKSPDKTPETPERVRGSC